MELSRIRGELYSAKPVDHETDFSCYVVDGEFGNDGIFCDGDDYAQMIDIEMKHQLSSNNEQPSPLFYMSRNSKFVINFIPPFISGFHDVAMGMGGVFAPILAELSSSLSKYNQCGEFGYGTSRIYVKITTDRWRRGEAEIGSTINRQPTQVVDVSKYGYDIDSKAETKTITIPKVTKGGNLTFGIDWSSEKRHKITADYMYKYTENTGGICVNLSSSTGQLQHPVSFSAYKEETIATIPKYAIYYSYGIYGSSGYIQNFSTLNIPKDKFVTNDGHYDYTNVIVSKFLTKDSIGGNILSFDPHMSTGTADILKANTSFTDTQHIGRAYVSPASQNEEEAEFRLEYTGEYFVAHSDNLIGNYILIKTENAVYATYGSDGNDVYKLKLDGDYTFLTSKPSANAGLQSSAFYDPWRSKKDDEIAYCGKLTSIVEISGVHLSDNFNVGILLRGTPENRANKNYANVYVLYEDGTSAISGELTISQETLQVAPFNKYNTSVAIQISPDGKNAKYNSDVAKRNYTNNPYLVYQGMAGGMVDGDFVVPENNTNKKIVALGLLYSDKFFSDLNNASNPYRGRLVMTNLCIAPSSKDKS